jgi:hypothetical protein
VEKERSEALAIYSDITELLHAKYSIESSTQQKKAARKRKIDFKSLKSKNILNNLVSMSLSKSTQFTQS